MTAKLVSVSKTKTFGLARLYQSICNSTRRAPDRVSCDLPMVGELAIGTRPSRYGRALFGIGRGKQLR